MVTGMGMSTARARSSTGEDKHLQRSRHPAVAFVGGVDHHEVEVSHRGLDERVLTGPCYERRRAPRPLKAVGTANGAGNRSSA